ncbi:MAG: substrate-binding domain-containing protein [Spirochaetota bacterium]|nr:substrate-binding domain-containing protein [Spirochaetota bacterium]
MYENFIKRIISNLISVFVLFLIFVGSVVISCSSKESCVLKMATTTSTDNTGLLDYLKHAVKSDIDLDLQWIAVGTGKALELGKNCDVDILLVHAPTSEKRYVNEGHGVDRKEVMFNDFIIIGPKNDPAGIKGKSVKQAFIAISSKKSLFASRGDNSGTNKKEILLWKAAGLPIPDRQSWYIQTGQGMINTINIASERNGYTMTDRGTYIKYESNMKGDPSLIILVQGDKTLQNQYSIIAINPKNCANVKYDLAKKFISWITSQKAQEKIGKFKLLGKQLFTPNAQK